MGLGAAPAAQPYPATQPHAAVADPRLAHRLDQRQMPGARAACPRMQQLFEAHALGDAHSMWCYGVVEPQQAPGIFGVPVAQGSWCGLLQRGETGLRGVKRVGELARIALEAQLAEDLDLRAVILDPRKEALHAARDGHIERALR